jgi:serine/threonine protein phosphatase 1
MLDFLDDPMRVAVMWLRFGGVETLASYGVWLEQSPFVAEEVYRLHEELSKAVPPRHIDFMKTLPLSASYGDYFFCHAGVSPDRPLDRQTKDDLIWIRDDFLSSNADFGKVVVHGHTPSEAPQIRTNRIGIDTAAFSSGNLTCLVLEGNSQDFL